MNCPKCDAELEFEGADPSVGIESGGWYCGDCDLFTSEHDVDREPMLGDVHVPMTEPRKPGERLGTPISELSGRPGHPGYAEFCRIARSWGYE